MLACDRGKLRWNQADLHKLVAVSMRIVLTFIISYVSCASQHYQLVWPIASGSTTGFFVWLFAGISWQINICLYTHPLGGWEVVLLVFAIHDCYSRWRGSDTFEWQKFMSAPSSLFSEHYLPLHLQLHLALVGKYPPNLITILCYMLKLAFVTKHMFSPEQYLHITNAQM
jgi:hypothetical protein